MNIKTLLCDYVTFEKYVKWRFFFSIIMITRKVKINLKDIQQSPDYNIVYNQGKIKMLK